MHIQQGNFGADIEPVYDRATYVLKHFSYSILDSSKGNAVVSQGTAKDLKSAVSAAEKQIGKLLEQHGREPSRSRAA
jgi:hypothetical protein